MKAFAFLAMTLLLFINPININYVNAQGEETHIFILWENALKSEHGDEIIKDIKENFKVLDIYKVSWTQENFSNNLKRLSKSPFYQEPKFFTKEFTDKRIKSNGTGSFLCIVVDVINPTLEKRKTIGNGTKKVCTNVFNKKYFYRDLVKDFTVHATDDIEETDRNLTLLIGKSLDDFKKEHLSDWDGKIKNYNSDLVGANGWKDVNEIMYVLKSYYKNIYLSQDADISMHFSSECPDEVKNCTGCILNLENVVNQNGENRSVIKIGDKKIICNLKEINKGDFVIEIPSKDVK